MQIITSLRDIKEQTEKLRSSGKTIGFVPTMGALHQGHLTLLETAAEQNDLSICSIFVNPTQFNNAEDFKLYPRILENDIEALKKSRCAMLFAPSVADMYPETLQLKFDFGELETVMEGKFRPGHFTGVAAIVSKLFHAVRPHKAYFGQKDLQQYAVINRLVTDLSFDLELVCHPIIREADGLAMSSRNRRLSEEQREQATQLYKALQLASGLSKAHTVAEVKEAVSKHLQPFAAIKLEYFEVADVNSLQPLAEFDASDRVALCIAAYVGEVRLIDNVII
ncbi:pantoate--beta-alanine ligase [Adhaeribacter aquaticus]|uniref:pantoate--beta-alanine ligase n=1 Tax=Adhaeribacter aquaticus TaxID=299567 RepID=UPI00041754E5|nr:pantoate--beta-alanine ligase [Adhaeribacter aquaticus]